MAAPPLVLRSHPTHLLGMRKRRRKKTVPLPLMMMELALASWETIGRRGAMIADGRCSPAEYSRMVIEKMSAATRSASSLSRSRRGLDWNGRLRTLAGCGASDLGGGSLLPGAARNVWGSCQIRWPTTGIGNDLQTGRNKRSLFGSSPLPQGAHLSERAFSWSPDALPSSRQ